MQLSGTPAAFAVVLLLNLNHHLFQCQPENRIISADCTLTGTGDANLVEDSGGSDEVPLVRNHLCSGESLFLTQKTCVPFRSARKWALAERASSHIYPPCSLLPRAWAACSHRKWPFQHKPNSKTFPHIACSWFLFKMVMIILFCNINGSTFGGG